MVLNIFRSCFRCRPTLDWFWCFDRWPTTRPLGRQASFQHPRTRLTASIRRKLGKLSSVICDPYFKLSWNNGDHRLLPRVDRHSGARGALQSRQIHHLIDSNRTILQSDLASGRRSPGQLRRMASHSSSICRVTTFRSTPSSIFCPERSFRTDQRALT